MLASSKAAIKKVLMHSSVATRLRRFYYPQDPLLPADVDCAVARANAWLFTQMKSGTTLVCHSPTFYNAVRLGIPNSDFDSIERGGGAKSWERLSMSEWAMRVSKALQRKSCGTYARQSPGL